jgi:hypothetical protein
LRGELPEALELGADVVLPALEALDAAAQLVDLRAETRAGVASAAAAAAADRLEHVAVAEALMGLLLDFDVDQAVEALEALELEVDRLPLGGGGNDLVQVPLAAGVAGAGVDLDGRDDVDLARGCGLGAHIS